MATSTFDREIIISDTKALEVLRRLMDDDTPGEPLSDHPFSYEDRKRGEMLLSRCPLRSPR